MKNHFQKTSTLVLAIFAALNLAACAPIQFGNQSQSTPKGVPEKPKGYCEVDPVDFNISASISEFAITDTENAKLRFDFLKGILDLLKLSFEFQTGMMSGSMTMREPLYPDTPLKTKMKGSYTEKRGGIYLGFKDFGLGLEAFKETPTGQVIESTLVDGIGKIEAELKKHRSKWRTTVFEGVSENEISFAVGSMADIVEGDQFAIYNWGNVWADPNRPCNSVLRSSAPTTSTPIAIAEAWYVDINSTQLKINWLKDGTSIQPGAKALIQKLVKYDNAQRTNLKSSVRILFDAKSEIQWTDGKKIDLNPFLKDQMGPLLESREYYIHE